MSMSSKRLDGRICEVNRVLMNSGGFWVLGLKEEGENPSGIFLCEATILEGNELKLAKNSVKKDRKKNSYLASRELLAEEIYKNLKIVTMLKRAGIEPYKLEDEYNVMSTRWNKGAIHFNKLFRRC